MCWGYNHYLLRGRALAPPLYGTLWPQILVGDNVRTLPGRKEVTGLTAPWPPLLCATVCLAAEYSVQGLGMGKGTGVTGLLLFLFPYSKVAMGEGKSVCSPTVHVLQIHWFNHYSIFLKSSTLVDVECFTTQLYSSSNILFVA